MSAYYVLTQTVTNQEKYISEYLPAVMPFLAKHGGEVIVANLQATALQGEPASGVVIIKFPSEENIRNFVDDPDYQPVKEIRLAATTDGNAVMT